MPARAPALLWRTVDAIWYAAGDTATDFNYYSKRGLLAGVYSATVLYWLEDRSEGFANTWSFLDRRIAEVMRVPQALASLQKRLAGIPVAALDPARRPVRAAQRLGDARHRRARRLVDVARREPCFQEIDEDADLLRTVGARG